ncbi:MAG: UDP-N-acetylglucosamine 1-carboxyvinyltransferase, partial [Thermotogota bacterium]
MSEMLIRGGRKLNGEVAISGSKNAVLPILAASLLTNERILIKRVPDLEDVRTMLEILSSLNIKTTFKNGEIEIEAHSTCKNSVPYHLIRKMRASFNILGPLSVIHNEAGVPLPGGCSIGPRPVDLHLMGLKQLGFENRIEHGVVFTERKEKHKVVIVNLPFPSVGATEQILSAAVKLKGTTTVINNAAREPEISQLIDFLTQMGAIITGKDTSTLKIDGVDELHGIEFEVIPDRMEAGTYLLAGLITN